MSKWTTTDDLDVPNVPGVYVVYFDDEPVYVGSSSNMRSRLSSHNIYYSRFSHSIKTPWGIRSTLRIKWRRSDVYGDWLMHELRLIRRLQPRFNRAGKALGVSRAS